MSDRIYIYDTTLRDGAQTEGISFSLEDKIEAAHQLDQFGMDFVEGGMPSSNPKDLELFTSADVRLENSRFTAFGSTCRADIKACNDEGLNVLASCRCEWVCIFGKAWNFHVREVLRTTLAENIRMISDSISFLRSKGKKVIFDAEHFFDGYASDPKYAMDVLTAAEEAEWIILCDTNGGSLPSFIKEATERAVSFTGKNIGIHCHNDSDLAVACTLAAVEAGARMVQGTVNGIGERCGNANLCSVLPDLKFKYGFDIRQDLTKLTSLSHEMFEITNSRRVPHMPFVGEKAFAHKGGMHVSALVKDTRTYEHITPESVGNNRKVLISDMSGRASISEKLNEFGISATDEQIKVLADKIKGLESNGYQYEGAMASFILLANRTMNYIEPPFTVNGFRLTMDGTGMNGIAEASIKVMDRSGNVEHTAADGEDGPVDALDKALRKALSKFYPVINDVRLIDYKVRVLDDSAATAASVRVLIRSTDGKNIWNTVGVSTNIIEASMIALSDSMEYAILLAENKERTK